MKERKKRAFELMKFFKFWRKQEKRSIRHPLVDILPWWCVIIFLIVFIAILAVVVCLGAFGVFPTYVETDTFTCCESNLTMGEFFKGETKISSFVSDLSGFNQELQIFFEFYRNDYYAFGFEKDDVKFTLDFHGTDDNENWELIHDRKIVERSLVCPSDRPNCDLIAIEWLPYIAYKRYRLDVGVSNGEELVENNFVSTEKMKVLHEYTNDTYSIFEVTLRYILFVFSACLFVFFVGYTFFVQLFKSWLLEQRMTALLLFTLMFYNNPFFICDIYVPGFFFPLANLLFVDSFICILLFCMLIIIHAAIKYPEQRTFFGFYFPKVLLSLVVWVVSLALLVYVRFRSSLDPTYSLSSYWFIGYIYVFLFLAILMYVFTLLFYIVRVFSFYCKGKLPAHYTRRAQLISFISLLVVLGTVINSVMMVFFGFRNSGQTISYFVGYNVYCLMLTLFYIPSHKVKTLAELKKSEAGYSLVDDLNDADYLELDEEDDLEDPKRMRKEEEEEEEEEEEFDGKDEESSSTSSSSSSGEEEEEEVEKEEEKSEVKNKEEEKEEEKEEDANTEDKEVKPYHSDDEKEKEEEEEKE